jgi:hypothetical protein
VKKIIHLCFAEMFTRISVNYESYRLIPSRLSPQEKVYEAEANQWVVMNDNSMLGNKDAEPIGVFPEDSVESVKKLLFLLSGESEVPESKHSPGFMKCGKYSARLVPAMNAEMVDRILADRQEQDQKNSEEIAE